MEDYNFGMYSLEDDDCNELFITQTPSVNQNLVDSEPMEGAESEVMEGVILDIGEDFEAHAFGTKEIADALPHYSDISDPEDDFINPVYGKTNRYLLYLFSCEGLVSTSKTSDKTNEVRDLWVSNRNISFHFYALRNGKSITN